MTLCFADDTLERRYRRQQIETSHKLSRFTIPLSCVMFASYALIEISLTHHFESLLLLRAGILVSVLSLFLLSRHARYRHRVNGLLCLASLSAALGTLAMFHLGNDHAVDHPTQWITMRCMRVNSRPISSVCYCWCSGPTPCWGCSSSMHWPADC
ncbi:hypothetical protein [Cobetia sp. ICG0124]|uniref:hypothetical protein n=1 Tax=Cobetia sp. ICG0124 TaxID=2053669 RepID=UPI0013E3C926|nr:hypothetical protein [Cobetia sp. ICG0124]